MTEQAYHARGAGRPMLYALETADGAWIDGDNCVYSEPTEAQDDADSRNEDLDPAQHVRVVPLYRGEPGADTGTTPPPDVWTCEACGYKSDDIGEYREVCGKCFSAAAERGTTPPEGRDIEQERLEADVPYSAEYLRGFEDGRRAATQRAPVENRKVKSE